ncbi:MAG: hypothetical protein CFE33_01665 [Pseudorhodobacter sp. PARRP1]|nr:MAG: hypothetical protein CFE33_01665 [Pseudorhodobacter sp. PARRP1]
MAIFKRRFNFFNQTIKAVFAQIIFNNFVFFRFFKLLTQRAVEIDMKPKCLLNNVIQCRSRKIAKRTIL